MPPVMGVSPRRLEPDHSAGALRYGTCEVKPSFQSQKTFRLSDHIVRHWREYFVVIRPSNNEDLVVGKQGCRMKVSSLTRLPTGTNGDDPVTFKVAELFMEPTAA